MENVIFGDLSDTTSATITKGFVTLLVLNVYLKEARPTQNFEFLKDSILGSFKVNFKKLLLENTFILALDSKAT